MVKLTTTVEYRTREGVRKVEIVVKAQSLKDCRKKKLEVLEDAITQYAVICTYESKIDYT